MTATTRHQLTVYNSHDSEDGLRTFFFGQNVSHCQQQQLFSELCTSSQTITLQTYTEYSWVHNIYKQVITG